MLSYDCLGRILDSCKCEMGLFVFREPLQRRVSLTRIVLSRVSLTAMAIPPLGSTIILDILGFCDVKTLKSFRRTSKTNYGLINKYETTICSSILERSYKLDAELLLMPNGPYHSPSLCSLFELDRRIRISQWLSAIVVHVGQKEAGYTDEDLSEALEWDCLTP